MAILFIFIINCKWLFFKGSYSTAKVIRIINDDLIFVGWLENNTNFEKIVRKNDILFESSFIIKMILRNALHYLDKITIAFIYFLLITSVLINGIYNNYIFLNDKYDECVSQQLEIKNSFIYKL